MKRTVVSELRMAQWIYGWNQSQMAEKLGMSRGHYSEVLSDKRRLPYNAVIRAYHLGVPADVLLSIDNLTV